MAKKQSRGTERSLNPGLFLYPHFEPPVTLGLQFFQWGEGGPSGDLNVKASTGIPRPSMLTMNIPLSVPVGPARFNFGMFPAPPQGEAFGRPVNPYNNFVSSPPDYSRIIGLSKS